MWITRNELPTLPANDYNNSNNKWTRFTKNGQRLPGKLKGKFVRTLRMHFTQRPQS
jgi:hypothetical protein